MQTGPVVKLSRAKKPIVAELLSRSTGGDGELSRLDTGEFCAEFPGHWRKWPARRAWLRALKGADVSLQNARVLV